jgi:hypothetical protein
MKRLITTLGLCVTVFSAMAVTAPRPANATPSIPIPPPRLAVPDLKGIDVASPKLSIYPPFLLRAELSSHIYLRPTGFPGYTWVICVVRNTGLINSGPFQTLLTKVYVGTPQLPGPAVATPVAMNIPAGGYQMFYFVEHAPVTIGLIADYNHDVPEYDETNNSYSVGIIP